MWDVKEVLPMLLLYFLWLAVFKRLSWKTWGSSCWVAVTDLCTKINLKNMIEPKYYFINAGGAVSFTPCIWSILLNTVQRSDRSLCRLHFELFITSMQFPGIFFLSPHNLWWNTTINCLILCTLMRTYAVWGWTRSRDPRLKNNTANRESERYCSWAWTELIMKAKLILLCELSSDLLFNVINFVNELIAKPGLKGKRNFTKSESALIWALY